MDTIHTSSHVKEKIHTMQIWGAKNLHILADFDRTLTKWFYEGKPISSIASFLYEDGNMSDEYKGEWKALFDHYYPIETDHTIDIEEKKLAMDTWREAHLRLMIKHKLSHKDIEKVVSHKELQLRQGANIFFDLLFTHEIPTIIMSASGIGYDSIWLFLEKKWISQKYIDVVSNAFIWSDDGYVVGRKWPVIHSMNKSETTIHKFPIVYKKISTRKNVILLWDSLHDIEMVDGFAYDTMLSIGFCLSDNKEVRDLFIQTYDIVIFDDGDMWYPLQILQQILQ